MYILSFWRFRLAISTRSAFLLCVFLGAQPTFTISEALEPQKHAHDAGLAMGILLIWRYSSFRQTGITLPLCFAFSLSREDSRFFSIFLLWEGFWFTKIQKVELGNGCIY